MHRRTIGLQPSRKGRLPRAILCNFTPERVCEGGWLMSYGTNTLELFRRAATYVDKILKGASPATCPSSSREVRAGINLKTAKALGLTIPQSLLQRADEGDR